MGINEIKKPDKPRIAMKGDLVQIHLVILEPKNRSANLSEATQAVPYEGWIKGYLLDDKAEIGQQVSIQSYIGRDLSGVLVDIDPVYDHNFGKPQAELNFIGINAWKKLRRED